jgi:drug/metabolite transporter (DMT)-like permease
VLPAQAPLRAIGLIVVALLLFSCLDATAKYLSAEHPVPQLVWARYFFHTLLMLAFLGPRRTGEIVKTGRLPLQVVRSTLLLLATLCFFTAISFIPLATATTIAFVSPLFVTALSVPILGERVGPRRWIAVAIGFLGVLLVIRPGIGDIHPAMFLPLGMAFFYGLYQILTRRLSDTEPPLTTLFYTATVGAALTTLFVPFFWEAPSTQAWLLMVAMGFFGGFGHLLLIQAFRYAPASMLAPFSYVQLVWVTILGFLIFGDLPDAYTTAGAAVIVGSGLFVFYREGVRARPAAAPPAGAAPQDQQGEIDRPERGRRRRTGT